ncbi:PREDICTED: zinc finger protein sens-like [Acromyrmex echinatior]|uniref:zinc finger protein sens-like n=1 Tax=Acromyrmex echinatior TaxID=103372 RepID=UPI0005810B6E|nr:PREDICTED: zinc finger protein sens-like [Acromyrmex echinatior]XP_011052284.1 PREDICTED: zinc finger protein sens-like [Acromyrmex echinatior]
MGAILSKKRESKDNRPYFIPYRIICYKCNVHFKTKICLDEHMQKVHDETSYICDYCNSISRTWLMFQQHTSIFHKDVAFCAYCYKAYTEQSNLFLHWKTHEPFECKICDDTFVTSQSLREHRIALHQNVPFQRMFFQRFRRSE